MTYRYHWFTFSQGIIDRAFRKQRDHHKYGGDKAECYDWEEREDPPGGSRDGAAATVHAASSPYPLASLRVPARTEAEQMHNHCQENGNLSICIDVFI